MIRMTKLTDYGIVLLTHIARDPERLTRNAPELAAAAHLPLPTVSKILKVLAREGLLVPHRGAKGGFSLARAPEEITVLDVIGALEGPIALTECSAHGTERCDIETLCPVSANWQRINRTVLGALRGITLVEMAASFGPPQGLFAGRPARGEARAGS
ncbi:MAG: SUF system Fe-S cluster assembly regulator [Deltaproteobacteria bacterium]|nr:SUF system Fe-S cluster assembly regulator [Deltaproteobacteria bacterium]